MKIRAANTILYCKKWIETVEFYRDRLKLSVITSKDWFVEFELNDLARLSVANELRSTVKSGQGMGVTVSLQVDDLEESRAELVLAGLEPTPIKEVWGSDVIYLRDPEGNRLEFWSGHEKTSGAAS